MYTISFRSLCVNSTLTITCGVIVFVVNASAINKSQCLQLNVFW